VSDDYTFHSEPNMCCSLSFHFTSAFVAVISSQLMASSSASWRLNKSPSNLVSGHKSTMCSLVCCSLQSQSGDEARPHLCILARYGPWLVRKRFNSVQEWRSRSQPGCRIVGSHTRWLLTTAVDNQSSSYCSLWSTGVVSAQTGRRAASRFCGWSNTSAYRGRIVMRTYSTFSDRVFAASGPWLWNSFSWHLKLVDVIVQ